MSFWKETGNILISVAKNKEVQDLALGLGRQISKGYIKNRLAKELKKQLNNALLNKLYRDFSFLLILIASFLLMKYTFFGERASLFITSSIYLTFLLYTTLKTIFLVYRYWKSIFTLLNEGLEAGILKFIETKYVFGGIANDVKEWLEKQTKGLIPTNEELIEYVLINQIKSLLVSILFFVGVLLSFNLIYKVLLIRKYNGHIKLGSVPFAICYEC